MSENTIKQVSGLIGVVIVAGASYLYQRRRNKASRKTVQENGTTATVSELRKEA